MSKILLLLALCAPLTSMADDSAGTSGAAGAKASASAEERRAHFEQKCQEDPERCEQMKQRNKERKQRCQANPEACKEKMGQARQKADRGGKRGS